MIGNVCVESDADLAKIIFTHRGLSGESRLRKSRQKETRQDSNHRDHHKKFYQAEPRARISRIRNCVHFASPQFKLCHFKTSNNRTNNAILIPREKINLSEIQKYSLYLFQSSENVSVIKNLVESSNNLLPSAQQDINLILKGNGQTRCHLLATTDHKIVSLYDPLNFLIPKDNVLDFEPEIAMHDGVNLDYIRDLESTLWV